jgi:hypothetical protein
VKRIKLTFPYPDWPLVNQCPNSKCIWGNYCFEVNPEPSDIKYCCHFVYNYLLSNEDYTRVEDNNVFLITGEPESTSDYALPFLSQFKGIITSQRKLPHPNKFYYPQGLPWHIGKSFSYIQEKEDLIKNNDLALITSDKKITKGHKNRLRFTYKIKEYFKDRIDIYGRGIQDFENKWDVQKNYRYLIVIENSSFYDYFTEKITDAFLSLNFPIYYGAPNLSDYFDANSFEEIDIRDTNKSIRSIESLIHSESHYDDHLSLLKTQKFKVLNEYNLFPLLVKFITLYCKSDVNDIDQYVVLQNNFIPRRSGFFHFFK